jgi:hypothetical protein
LGKGTGGTFMPLQLDSRLRKPPAEKKRPQTAYAQPVPAFCTWPNNRLRAPQKLRGAFTSRSFLSVIPAVVGLSDRDDVPRLWSAWRFHVPRIWFRSIELRAVPVKRKSQNLANFLRKRPYLVVPLPDKPPRFVAIFSAHFF